MTEHITLITVLMSEGKNILSIISMINTIGMRNFNGIRSSRISTQMVLDEIAAASHAE
jgi:hypothetical protein